MALPPGRICRDVLLLWRLPFSSDFREWRRMAVVHQSGSCGLASPFFAEATMTYLGSRRPRFSATTTIFQVTTTSFLGATTTFLGSLRPRFLATATFFGVTATSFLEATTAFLGSLRPHFLATTTIFWVTTTPFFEVTTTFYWSLRPTRKFLLVFCLSAGVPGFLFERGRARLVVEARVFPACF